MLFILPQRHLLKLLITNQLMQQSIHKQVKQNIITQILNKITNQKQFEVLKSAIVNLPNEQLQLQSSQNIPQNSQAPISQLKYHKIDIEDIKEASKQPQNSIQGSQVTPKALKSQPSSKLEKETSQIMPVTAQKSKKYQQQSKPQPLSQPPLISQRKLNTDQSSQKSKTYQKQSIFESRKSKQRSSQQESINLQLTQKTKRSKNLSNTQGRVDSLLYSDVTLMYSNDGGFDTTNNRNFSGKSQKSVSQKVLPKVPDNEGQEVSQKIDRAQSRECDHIRTESQAPTQQQLNSQIPTQQNEDVGIFKTQINEYRHKVSRIRELKENKKKKLQAQLTKVNQQLQNLTKQQQAFASPSISRANNYQSRVKISDNIEAKAKAVKLVKDLRYQKRTRQDAHLEDLHVIDKNINGFMEELMRQRAINQERIKQRKKLEIISRMKQQQQRKIQEQKKKEMNQQFLQQLKGSNSKQNIQKGQSRIAQESSKGSRAPAFAQPTKSKGRTPTKKSQPDEITPELAKKKAYLKQIRNLSFRKSAVDPYQQALN